MSGFTRVWSATLGGVDTLIANATITFLPVTSEGTVVSPVIGEGGGKWDETSVSALITNGAFTIDLPDTKKTLPIDIGYKVTVRDNNSTRILMRQGYDCFQPSGDSVDFATVPPNVAKSATVQYGPSGLSAYELWIKNGHVGSEADYEASNKGATGSIETPIPNPIVFQSDVSISQERTSLLAGNRLGLSWARTDDANGFVQMGGRPDGTLYGNNLGVDSSSHANCTDGLNTFYVGRVFDPARQVYTSQIFGNYPAMTPNVRQLTTIGNNNFPAIGSDRETISFWTDRNGSEQLFTMTKYGADQGLPIADKLDAFSLFHCFVTGQSNAVGWASALIARPASLFDLMFNSGPRVGVGVGGTPIPGGAMASFVGLQEVYDSGGGAETISTGAALSVRTLLNKAARSIKTFWTVAAQNGTQLAGITVGTQVYINAMAEVVAAKALALAAGFTYVVRFMILIHGEQDEAIATTSYADKVAAYQLSFSKDVKTASGQSLSVLCGVLQMGNESSFAQLNAGGVPNHVAGTVDHGSIPLEQLSLLERYPELFFGVAGGGMFSFSGDWQHYTAPSRDWQGEYAGKAMALVLQGNYNTVVRPKRIARQGTSVLIEFYVPVEPLVLDNSYGNPIAGSFYNFTASDNTGANIAITGGAVINGRFLQLTVASDPGVGQLFIEAGYRVPYYAANSGPNNGNGYIPTPVFLRDSDPTPSQFGLLPTLVNYCWKFRKVC